MRKAATPQDREVFNRYTDDALKAGPWSVTFHRPTPNTTRAGPNDYYSEGPYWWPDPKNRNGPYIRRDGERYPERFIANHSDAGKMCEAVLALGIGAALLNKAGCADHANKVLSVWFLDSKTRMNPNLEYGQAIPRVTTGRGTGLIDMVSMIHAVEGILLLEFAGGLDASVSQGVRQWYGEFLQWMTTSRKGLDEKTSGNNHATWWTAQVASYAALTANAQVRRMAWQHYRDYLVPSEIRPDGSCPREEARTNSLSYSSMNLDAFSTICRLAEMDGVDLWHFRAPNGGSVATAFDYLVPYILHPETWRHQQISTYSAAGHYFPGLAGIGLPSRKLLDAYYRLPRGEAVWALFLDLLVRASEPKPVQTS